MFGRFLKSKSAPDAVAYVPHARGRQAENFACEYLQQKKLKLLARNFRCATGEIDLVMRDGDTVVFVEVRARRSDAYGGGAETVDRRKQAKLAATAALWLQAEKYNGACRFDVVSISLASQPPSLDWIRNAFDVSF